MTATTSPVQVSAQAVEQMIRKDITSADALAKLLTHEHEVLQSRDHQGLSALLERKQALMAQLEQNARQRSGWIKFLAERTRLPAEQCWERLLQELANPEVSELWQQFQGKIKDCKNANEINGKMISRGQRTLKQLLGIIRGQQVQNPKLYTAAGDTRTQNQSHTVIKV